MRTRAEGTSAPALETAETSTSGTAAQLASHLLGELHAKADAANVAGMSRYGISVVGTLGIPMPVVRGLAREAERAVPHDEAVRHELALLLWESRVHEARILAALLDPPALVTPEQALSWALDLDSWDTCDQLCSNLLWRTDFAWELPVQWSERRETFVKRAAFVVAAQLAVKAKKAPDAQLIALLPLVEREAGDERNDVKKGVNWALRQIGKRSIACRAAALDSATRILANAQARGGTPEEAAARWIARDALRELTSDSVQRRLGLLP